MYVREALRSVPARLPAAQARRYVSPRGSDASPGTLGRPWRTVQHGLDSLRPGQALLIRRGTFRENLVMTRAGTPARPMTIRNYPREHPILRPGNTDRDNMPLQIGSGAAHLIFRGLVFEGANGSSTTNIYAWGSAHDITLTSCESRGSARQGFFSERTTRSIRIVGCYFHDNGGSGPHNLDHNLYVEGRRHLIANCLITGAKNGFGIQVYPDTDRVVITSNTIVGNHSGIILGGEGSKTTSHALVVNNILAFNEEYGLTADWGDSSGTGNVAENNLGFGNGERGFDSSAGGIAMHRNLDRDPGFVRRSAGDYHLRAGSAALDWALRGYSPGTDFDGRRRPQGRRSDVGAFERAR
jgi:hypothetical protein